MHRSHELIGHHDGGYDYRVSVNGLTVTGWRKGSKHDVESYAAHLAKDWELRADDKRAQKMAYGRHIKKKAKVKPSTMPKELEELDTDI